MYGDLLNNTGQAQTLVFVLGDFYDDQGKLIKEASTFDYWPVEVVPQGSQVPFELTIFDVERLGRYELSVSAEPSFEDEIPHQAFEFLDINSSAASGDYCVSGRLRNQNGVLDRYISVVVVLYNEQDSVVNFSDHYAFGPDNVVSDQTLDFEVCVDPLSQSIARYDIRAWGL